jgi:hypothetical protein
VRRVPRQPVAKVPASFDTVAQEVDLPLQRRVYPLGFPLDISTNSKDVLDAASEGWGLFAQAFDEAPVRISLAVVESDAGPEQARSHFFWRENLMSIFDSPQNFLLCDFLRGFACGSVTRAVALDHPMLRYRFLTAGAYPMISHRALAPLHGAAIVRNGSGVLLCGESCAGKSTLAYAASRAGWTYVSDDATFLLRGRQDRCAIGDPHSIRFREDARRFFPELMDRLTVVRPNGKPAIEVLTRELPIAVASQCSIDHVVLLARQESGSAHLASFSKDRALENFKQYVACGTAEVRAAQLACHRRLLGADIWELRYANLDDAVRQLERVVDSGASTNAGTRQSH